MNPDYHLIFINYIVDIMLRLLAHLTRFFVLKLSLD